MNGWLIGMSVWFGCGFVAACILDYYLKRMDIEWPIRLLAFVVATACGPILFIIGAAKPAKYVGSSWTKTSSTRPTRMFSRS